MNDDNLWDTELDYQDNKEVNEDSLFFGDEESDEDSLFFGDEESDEEDDIFSSELSDFLEEDSVVEQEQSLISSARVRLEQGRLYEMLIKHDLFDGVEALPEAVAQVQKEIKSFIMERLEILLGMKTEKSQENVVQQVVNAPQFNDMEVQALKMIASKVTKGASVNAPTSTATPEEPVSKPALNAIKGGNKPQTIKSVSQPTKSVAQPVKTPTPSKGRPVRQAPPVKKSMLKKTHENIIEAAKHDLKYVEGLSQLSLEDANKIVSKRHNRPVAKIDPNMSQEMINQHYTTKVSMDPKAQTYTALLKLANK